VRIHQPGRGVIGPEVGSNAIAGVADGVGSVLNCPHIRPWSHPGFGVGGPVDDLSTVYCQGSSGFRIAGLHADQCTYPMFPISVLHTGNKALGSFTGSSPFVTIAKKCKVDTKSIPQFL
jgi:hypothetical protein